MNLWVNSIFFKKKQIIFYKIKENFEENDSNSINSLDLFEDKKKKVHFAREEKKQKSFIIEKKEPFKVEPKSKTLIDLSYPVLEEKNLLSEYPSKNFQNPNNSKKRSQSFVSKKDYNKNAKMSFKSFEIYSKKTGFDDKINWDLTTQNSFFDCELTDLGLNTTNNMDTVKIFKFYSPENNANVILKKYNHSLLLNQRQKKVSKEYLLKQSCIPKK